MDEAERQVLKRRLARMFRAIYLTSQTCANVCSAHARRVHEGDVAARLLAHAQELAERRDEAAAWLAEMGHSRPWSRALVHPLTLAWGRLTCLTGKSFSLHMLGNMEAQGEKLTAYADKLARELADVAATEALVRMARAAGARRAFIIAELERIA